MSKGQVIGWCAVAACWALSSCAAVGGGAASGGAAGAGPVVAAVPAVAGSGVMVAPRSDPAGIVPTEGMCMISPVRTVAELADREDTHSVVLGKVVETADFCSEGRGYRLLTIAVDSSYKAGLTGEVKVVEPGTTLAPDCRPEAPGEKSESQPGAYADFPFERHLRTEPGVEVVAFLSAEKTGEKGATHSLVTGPQGLFVKRDKAFVRSIVDDEAARADGIESRIPADGVREMLSRLTR